MALLQTIFGPNINSPAGKNGIYFSADLIYYSTEASLSDCQPIPWMRLFLGSCFTPVRWLLLQISLRTTRRNKLKRDHYTLEAIYTQNMKWPEYYYRRCSIGILKQLKVAKTFPKSMTLRLIAFLTGLWAFETCYWFLGKMHSMKSYFWKRRTLSCPLQCLTVWTLYCAQSLI